MPFEGEGWDDEAGELETNDNNENTSAAQATDLAVKNIIFTGLKLSD